MSASIFRRFYGHENPYQPAGSIKWLPAILTIAWWRWCLRHNRNPFRGLAKLRIQAYYRRHIKFRILRLPLCWILKHKSYKTVDWTYSAIRCSRCHRTLEYTPHNK